MKDTVKWMALMPAAVAINTTKEYLLQAVIPVP